jgi:hypothetical protein
MCECPSVYSYKRERERKLFVSCSFSFFLFKVWCYLGFKWPLFIVFINANAHIFKWCWGQSIGNCPVWWSMIWACACGQAKGASLTLSYIYIHTLDTFDIKKIIWIMVDLHLKLANDDDGENFFSNSISVYSACLLPKWDRSSRNNNYSIE